jgi:hypothetical protein
MRLYLINPFNSLVSLTNLKESRWNRFPRHLAEPAMGHLVAVDGFMVIVKLQHVKIF